MFLGPIGLARLQITASLPMSALVPAHIWQRCISADFPRLAVNPACFELPQRHDLMRCYGPLRRSILAEGELPLIENIAEAEQLAKLLHGMERASVRHLSQGGRVASILVGRFHMSACIGNHSIVAMVTQGPANVFMLPQDFHEASGMPNIGLPIRLGLAHNVVILQAGEGQILQTQIRAQHPGLIMDVKAASAEGVLNYPRVSLQVDGRLCVAHTGMHFFPQCERSSAIDNDLEVLCALFLRDGERKSWKYDLANTLNLDTAHDNKSLYFQKFV